MTDKKISELPSITGADVNDANDVLPIVDTSVATTKKITRAELFKNVKRLGIGTSSPQYKVNINNTDTSTDFIANPLLVLTNDQYTFGTGATLGFGFTSNTIGAAITGRSAQSGAGGYLTFETRDTFGTVGERMRIDSSGNVLCGSDGGGDIGSSTKRFKDLYLSGGVYLGGTGAANYLDDYEEGTWTPTAIGTTTDPTVTYNSSTAGRYTKVGNHVNFWFYIKLDSVSGGSGDLNIGGLPFTNVNQGDASYGHTTSINSYLNTNLASGRIPAGYAIVGNNKIYIVVNGAGSDTTSYSVTSMSNGFALYGSGTLSVA